jgi:CxxC-x17-CxxC domain-containing protein
MCPHGHDWLGLTAAETAFANGLFNQQFWLWGCDIRRAEGNLLLEYGLVRQRPPEGHAGSRVYRCQLSAEATLLLWSFGIFCGDLQTGGVYLARYNFAPLASAGFASEPLPWLPDQLPATAHPHTIAATQACRRWLQCMVRWIIEYEQWVVTTIGLAYRQACVAAWELGPFTISSERIVSEWHQLEQRCSGRVSHRLPITNCKSQLAGVKSMSYQDKTIMCRDCGEPFVFTAGEQEFYASKGFTNEPTRCATCRKNRKQSSGGRGGYSGGGYGGGYSGGRGYRDEGYRDEGYNRGGQREMYTVPCSEPGCTIDAVVPFKPRGDKPVYCNECFEKRRPTARW